MINRRPEFGQKVPPLPDYDVKFAKYLARTFVPIFGVLSGVVVGKEVFGLDSGVGMGIFLLTLLTEMGVLGGLIVRDRHRQQVLPKQLELPDPN